MKQFFADAILQADNSNPNGDDTTSVHNVPTLVVGTVFHNGLDIMYFLLGAIAVIVIIVSGILYATSAGNASTIARAKNAIIYAIVGIIVVLVAFTITQFITGNF
jgi:hypothetical protein